MLEPCPEPWFAIRFELIEQPCSWTLPLRSNLSQPLVSVGPEMLDATRQQPGGDRIDALMDGIVSTGKMTVEAFDTLQHLIGHFERLV